MLQPDHNNNAPDGGKPPSQEARRSHLPPLLPLAELAPLSVDQQTLTDAVIQSVRQALKMNLWLYKRHDYKELDKSLEMLREEGLDPEMRDLFTRLVKTDRGWHRNALTNCVLACASSAAMRGPVLRSMSACLDYALVQGEDITDVVSLFSNLACRGGGHAEFQSGLQKFVAAVMERGERLIRCLEQANKLMGRMDAEQSSVFVHAIAGNLYRNMDIGSLIGVIMRLPRHSVVYDCCRNIINHELLLNHDPFPVIRGFDSLFSDGDIFQKAAVIERVLEAYGKRKQSVAAAMETFMAMGNDNWGAAFMQPMLDDVLRRGLRVEGFSPQAFRQPVSADAWEVYLKIAEYSAVQELPVADCITIFKEVREWASRAGNVVKIKNALEQGAWESGLPAQLKAQYLLRTLLSADRYDVMDNIVFSMFQEDTINDHMPFNEGDPRAAKMFAETVQVMRRANDIYYGFGALKHDATVDCGEEPLILGLGRNCAELTYILNVRDSKKFPGRGYMLRGLIPERLLPAGGEPGNLYGDVKKALPWMAHAVDEMHLTSYLFTRSFVAVIPPDSFDYKIRGVHYSYINYNEHHENAGDIALAVPTDLFLPRISACAVPYDDYRGYDAGRAELGSAGLLPQELKKAASYGAPVLNLAWGSNFGGGLANAFPPQSAPFHLWERSLEQETKDIWGHVHKSHFWTGYSDHLEESGERYMLPLRRAHEEVYRIATLCQNHYDLFRLSLAFYHKGQTLSASGAGDEPVSGIKTAEDGEIPAAGNTMLRRVYLKRQDLMERRAPDGEYPVLRPVPVFSYFDVPRVPADEDFILDVKSLTITDRNGKVYKLPEDADGSGQRELKIWNSVVRPDSLQDLRFYPKE